MNEGEVEILGVAPGRSDGQPDAEQTMKGTKFEMLLPALLPTAGPGAITPTKKVPGVVRSDLGMSAWICVALSTFVINFTLVLFEEFHVTLDPAANPEPFTVKRMSLLAGAFAPLGVIDDIAELTVGEAPR